MGLGDVPPGLLSFCQRELSSERRRIVDDAGEIVREVKVASEPDER
jgi:hypothetical protein